jgi:hypothetical protein
MSVCGQNLSCYISVTCYETLFEHQLNALKGPADESFDRWLLIRIIFRKAKTGNLNGTTPLPINIFTLSGFTIKIKYIFEELKNCGMRNWFLGY